MAPIELLSYAGWAAYLSGAATVVALVSGVLFFTKGQPFGTKNDIASVFQVLFMLPIVLALYYLSSSEAGDSA